MLGLMVCVRVLDLGGVRVEGLVRGLGLCCSFFFVCVCVAGFRVVGLWGLQ